MKNQLNRLLTAGIVVTGTFVAFQGLGAFLKLVVVEWPL